jgi:hypothetical protein
MPPPRVRSTLGRSRIFVITALAAMAFAGAMWITHGILATLHATGQTAPPQAVATPATPVTLEGPFTHANLAIYIVRGASQDSRAYLTLDQGLAARTVDVREIGAGAGRDQSTVNSLEIQNKSDQWLFLHAGDIVKGGKQDRTITTDVLLAPRSKPQTIDAFCVEQGRWTPSRDGLAFKENPGMVAGNSLKHAIQSEKSQSRVWQEVAVAERRAVTVAAAAGSVSPGVAALSSTGTYNAITENKALDGGRGAYVGALLPSLRKYKDAIGVAVAINGRITAADVYRSPSLFEAVSGKLLDSYALEALLARGPDRQSPPPAKQQVTTFLASAAGARAATETVGQSMHRSTRETSDAVMYEYGHVTTAATGRRDVSVLHKSYLKK